MSDQLNGSEVSPTGDLRFIATFTRTSDDIDPGSGLATNYSDCQIVMQFFLSTSGGAIASLSIDSGLTRVTNLAGSQVISGVLSQSLLESYKGKRLLYRITLTTNTGAKVSGGAQKPGYSGFFTIGRY